MHTYLHIEHIYTRKGSHREETYKSKKIFNMCKSLLNVFSLLINVFVVCILLHELFYKFIKAKYSFATSKKYLDMFKTLPIVVICRQKYFIQSGLDCEGDLPQM